MDSPVNGLTGAFFPVDTVYFEYSAESVGILDIGKGGLFGCQHKHADADNSYTETDLHNVGGQRKTEHGAYDRTT